MLALLSPAKKLNFDKSPVNIDGGNPKFTKQANELVSILRELDFQKMKTLFPISEKLLRLNMDRYKNF